MRRRVMEFFGLLVILLACYTVSGTNHSTALCIEGLFFSEWKS